MNKHKKRNIIAVLAVFVIVASFFTAKTLNSRNKSGFALIDSESKTSFATGGDSLGHNIYAPVILEIKTCQPGRSSLDFGLGHTEFLVEGQKDGKCYFNHVTEIENPNWDRTLDIACRVPLDTNARLKVNDAGIDFSTIKNYCTKLN